MAEAVIGRTDKSMDDRSWPTVRLGELISVEHGWAFNSKHFCEFTGSEPIVVAIGNFQYTGGFRFGSTSLKGYDSDYPPEYDLTPGDILLVMTCQTPGGEILGIPGRIPDDGNLYLHNQRLGKVVVNDRDRLDDSFVYWLCLSPAFNRHLFVTATGTKILHTSPSRIEDFTFRLPPTSTQKRIADVLDSLQEKIDLNEGMNQTLEEMAQSLYRHWFVDFTPLRGSAFDESDMGAIPAGWVAKPLDEVADFLNGVAWSRYKAKEGEDSLPVLKIRELRQGFDEQSNRVGPKLPEKYVIKDGDVIFSWSGTLLQKRWSGGTGALNQHLFKVTSNAYPEWFFYYGINHHIEEFRRIAANKATTMGHINRDHLSSALVAVPPSDVLEEVGQQLRPLFDMQLANDLEARSLVATRDYLLPKLLSGEVTVEEAEEEVEATV